MRCLQTDHCCDHHDGEHEFTWTCFLQGFTLNEGFGFTDVCSDRLENSWCAPVQDYVSSRFVCVRELMVSHFILLRSVNFCKGAHRVTELEQFSVRISKDEGALSLEIELDVFCLFLFCLLLFFKSVNPWAHLQTQVSYPVGTFANMDTVVDLSTSITR